MMRIVVRLVGFLFWHWVVVGILTPIPFRRYLSDALVFAADSHYTAGGAPH
jgi:hypothetical protein